MKKMYMASYAKSCAEFEKKKHNAESNQPRAGWFDTAQSPSVQNQTLASNLSVKSPIYNVDDQSESTSPISISTASSVPNIAPIPPEKPITTQYSTQMNKQSIQTIQYFNGIMESLISQAKTQTTPGVIQNIINIYQLSKTGRDNNYQNNESTPLTLNNLEPTTHASHSIYTTTPILVEKSSNVGEENVATTSSRRDIIEKNTRSVNKQRDNNPSNTVNQQKQIKQIACLDNDKQNNIASANKDDRLERGERRINREDAPTDKTSTGSSAQEQNPRSANEGKGAERGERKANRKNTSSDNNSADISAQEKNPRNDSICSSNMSKKKKILINKGMSVSTAELLKNDLEDIILSKEKMSWRRSVRSATEKCSSTNNENLSNQVSLPKGNIPTNKKTPEEIQAKEQEFTSKLKEIFKEIHDTFTTTNAILGHIYATNIKTAEMFEIFLNKTMYGDKEVVETTENLNRIDAEKPDTETSNINPVDKEKQVTTDVDDTVCGSSTKRTDQKQKQVSEKQNKEGYCEKCKKPKTKTALKQKTSLKEQCNRIDKTAKTKLTFKRKSGGEEQRNDENNTHKSPKKQTQTKKQAAEKQIDDYSDKIRKETSAHKKKVKRVIYDEYEVVMPPQAKVTLKRKSVAERDIDNDEHCKSKKRRHESRLSSENCTESNDAQGDDTVDENELPYTPKANSYQNVLQQKYYKRLEKIKNQNRKIEGTNMVLPAEYDEHDTKWTLKYKENSPGAVELIKDTGVYVNSIRLLDCLRRARYNCRALARNLIREVFTENALIVCTAPGNKTLKGKLILDDWAFYVMFDYIKEVGKKKDWLPARECDILNSTRYVIYHLKNMASKKTTTLPSQPSSSERN